MKDYRDAFIEMMEAMKISGRQLAKASGVQESQICLFRKGKELTTKTFFDLIKAADFLEPGAANYFTRLLGDDVGEDDFNAERFIQSLTRKKLGEVLIAAGKRLDPDKGKAKPGKRKAEPDKRKAEPENGRAEPDKDKAEPKVLQKTA